MTNLKASTAPRTAAFANAPKPATVAPAAGTTVVAGKARTLPVLTAARSDVAMPTIQSKRGSKTSYNFESLTAIGMSFGVKNKTAKQLASVVSNYNKKFLAPQKDTNGNPLFEMVEMKDAAGVVTQVPNTKKPITAATKHYFAYDVDAKSDPDGANVRIFRDL